MVPVICAYFSFDDNSAVQFLLLNNVGDVDLVIEFVEVRALHLFYALIVIF